MIGTIDIHEYSSTSFNKKPAKMLLRWKNWPFVDHTSRPKTLSPSQSRRHKVSKTKSDEPPEADPTVGEWSWSLVEFSKPLSFTWPFAKWKSAS